MPPSVAASVGIFEPRGSKAGCRDARRSGKDESVSTESNLWWDFFSDNTTVSWV